ncbi:hypothetical protein [Frigoribacterium sp. CFBP 13707]|uniref:hypothetical protein n=1 Tax=Frigoribacterium sp. CFBP 13707 TaxID=2775313 RepID=UPI001A7E737C|nr:hypothetical protein [Frigoribacterium sp. CFBP 13707]
MPGRRRAARSAGGAGRLARASRVVVGARGAPVPLVACGVLPCKVLPCGVLTYEVLPWWLLT